MPYNYLHLTSSDFTQLDKGRHLHLNLFVYKGCQMKVKEYFEQGYDKQTTKNYKEAIKDYDKVIELDNGFERAYVQRGFCRFQLK